jgi:hypothetical protein
MIGRVYTVNFENVSVSAAQDFFEISPGDDKPVELVGLFLSQAGNSDVGDAAEECLRWSIVRGHATSGSGGTAPTARPVKVQDAAAGFAAEVNNTTIASAGTGVTLHADSFNVRVGTQVWFPPGSEPDCSQGSGVIIVVRLLGAPADAITLSGTLYVREFG